MSDPPDGLDALIQQWRERAAHFAKLSYYAREDTTRTFETFADELEAVILRLRQPKTAQKEQGDLSRMDTMGDSTDSLAASTVLSIARRLLDQNGGPIQSEVSQDRGETGEDYVMVRMADFRALADAIDASEVDAGRLRQPPTQPQLTFQEMRYFAAAFAVQDPDLDDWAAFGMAVLQHHLHSSRAVGQPPAPTSERWNGCLMSGWWRSEK